jgi:hypothetical protein
MTDHYAAPPSAAPKSVRIAAVCEREIAAITARIAACSQPGTRTRLLRERADIQQLLEFAVAQDDYKAWIAPCPSAVSLKA